MARNAPGVVRATTPADEMDKTVNVSVMEGLNAGVRGNNTYEAIGTTLATPSTTMASGLAQDAGAAGRLFGEASCI